MDRLVHVTIAGKPRTLNFSIEVMFDMTDKFGSIQEALTKLGKNDREGFETLRWFAIRMANDGELVRREAGYDHEPLLEEKDVTARMKPVDYEELKSAVVEAISMGYKREIEDKDVDVDLGLAELNQKKTRGGESAPITTT
jgi:hypothetical protein